MFVAAAVQLTSTSDEEANWQSARALIERAAGHGARFVATPENTNYLGPHEEKVRRAEPLDGETCGRFAELARRLGIHLLLGSFNEKSDEAARCYNTSVFFSPDGGDPRAPTARSTCSTSTARRRALRRVGDLQAGRGARWSSRRRSAASACRSATTCASPSSTARLADAGAEILVVPSAFTLATGKDHWEPLLRARAIENQCCVIAAGPARPARRRRPARRPGGTP